MLALENAGGVGASAIGSGPSGAPGVSVTSTAAGSLTFAVGDDWSKAIGRTPTPLFQWIDSTSGNTFWVQSAAPTTTAGQVVTLASTAPTADRWNLAAVDIVPSGTVPPPPDNMPPTVNITNPTVGQTVSGTVPVAATASDNVAVASVQFLLDGNPLGAPVTAPPYAVQWDTTTATNAGHTLSARATDTSGNIGTATGVAVTVQNPAPPSPACFNMDVSVSSHGHGATVSPVFFTAQPGETLLAFVGSDGPSGAGKQSATVSGAGLTWTLVKRANAQAGDAEIWTAQAPAILSGVTVTSTPLVGGYDQSLTVIAMQMTNGVGASAAASAATGAPRVSLSTTDAGSLVFAVGEDWSRSVARTLPAGQVTLDQWLDTRTGDTYWSQYTNVPTGPLGSVVNMTDTAPTNDKFNMVAVELTADSD